MNTAHHHQLPILSPYGSTTHTLPLPTRSLSLTDMLANVTRKRPTPIRQSHSGYDLNTVVVHLVWQVVRWNRHVVVYKTYYKEK